MWNIVVAAESAKYPTPIPSERHLRTYHVYKCKTICNDCCQWPLIQYLLPRRFQFQPGLPDGILEYTKKSNYGIIGMETLGLLGHFKGFLTRFGAFFGIFFVVVYIFFKFWYATPNKSGNPEFPTQLIIGRCCRDYGNRNYLLQLGPFKTADPAKTEEDFKKRFFGLFKVTQKLFFDE
jgi:hypothetical protein